jgi:multidrug efflux pump
MIDQTLYDAYGQREVSTMFTQLNQYHVVLEVKPRSSRSRWICAICISAPARDPALRFRPGGGRFVHTAVGQGPANSSSAATTAANAATTEQSSSSLASSSIASAAVFQRRPGAAERFYACAIIAVPITVNHQGQFPVVTLSFNLAPNASLGDAVNAVNKVKDEIGMPPASRGVSGHRAGVSGVAGQRTGADSGGADHGVYRARRAL